MQRRGKVAAEPALARLPDDWNSRPGGGNEVGAAAAENCPFLDKLGRRLRCDQQPHSQVRFGQNEMEVMATQKSVQACLWDSTHL